MLSNTERHFECQFSSAGENEIVWDLGNGVRKFLFNDLSYSGANRKKLLVLVCTYATLSKLKHVIDIFRKKAIFVKVHGFTYLVLFGHIFLNFGF